MKVKPQHFVLFLALLWMTALVLMVQDYINYPPLDASSPLSDRRGNLDGNIYKYGLFSLAELLAGIFLIRCFFSIPLLPRFLLLLSLPGLVAWAFIDAMYSGGVASGHALWLVAEVISAYIFLLVVFLTRKPKHPGIGNT